MSKQALPGAPLRVLATFVALQAAMAGAAHAAIDVGNTIESVTTTTKEWGEWQHLLHSETTSTLVSHAGVLDQSLGLYWIKATSLEEGMAQGYRLATAAEFQSLLLDKGWTADDNLGKQWSLTSGLNYINSSIFYESHNLVSETSTRESNLANASFNADATGVGRPGWGSGTLSASLAWLDGGSAGLQLGAWLDNKFTYHIQGAAPQAIDSTVTQYTHTAAVDSLEALQGRGGNWAIVTGGVKSSSLSYFMVSSVPEPSAAWTMGLGLLAVGAVSGLRRRGWRAVRQGALLVVGGLALVSAARADFTDPVTGDVWTLTKSVEDAQLQGFRAAHAEELVSLVAHTGRLVGTADVFRFYFSIQPFFDEHSVHMSHSYTEGTGYGHNAIGWGDDFYTGIGWLDGVKGGNMAVTYTSEGLGYSEDRQNIWISTLDAALLNSRVSSNIQAALNKGAGAFYMVRAVPEPAASSMMLLGLAAAGAVAQVKRRRGRATPA